MFLKYIQKYSYRSCEYNLRGSFIIEKVGIDFFFLFFFLFDLENVVQTLVDSLYSIEATVQLEKKMLGTTIFKFLDQEVHQQDLKER